MCGCVNVSAPLHEQILLLPVNESSLKVTCKTLHVSLLVETLWVYEPIGVDNTPKYEGQGLS